LIREKTANWGKRMNAEIKNIRREEHRGNQARQFCP